MPVSWVVVGPCATYSKHRRNEDERSWLTAEIQEELMVCRRHLPPVRSSISTYYIRFSRRRIVDSINLFFVTSRCSQVVFLYVDVVKVITIVN